MHKEPTMASLDFEQEQYVFRRYYESNRKQFADVKNAYIRIISSLIKRSDVGEVTKIEGRVIRHSLYLCDQETFGRILTKGTRDRFAGWLKSYRGGSG